MYSLSYLYFKFLKKIRFYGALNSVIHRSSKLESGTSFVNSTMDKHSFCGYNCSINNTTIGKYCSIGTNVIIGGGNHPIDWISTSPAFYDGRDSIKLKISKHRRNIPMTTIIKNDVWIGDGVIIKQGVSVGHGAIVGFGSRVTKNVPDYAIVAGNPAKILRYRFDEEIIKELLNLNWWDKNENELKRYSSKTNNVIEFIDGFKK